MIWELLGLVLLGLLVLSGLFWVLLFAAIPIIVIFALGVAALAVVGSLVGVAFGLLEALGGVFVVVLGSPLLLALGVGFLLWTALGRKGLARARLRASGRRPRCPECWEVVPKDASVCPQCFADLWANCPQCGHIHRVGALFCPDCGRSLRLKPKASV